MKTVKTHTTLTEQDILAVKTVTRINLSNGKFQFRDQDGNILRGTATRPYTHMALQSCCSYTRRWTDMDDVEHVDVVPKGYFLTFHSKSNPKPAHNCYTIERVIAVNEA